MTPWLRRTARRAEPYLRWRGRWLRRELGAAYLRLRARNRLTPTFLIIGVMKGGTTSLYEYLLQHPAVGGSEPKEVWFFNSEYHRGLRWYQGHSPTRSFPRRIRDDLGIEPAIGEATV